MKILGVKMVGLKDALKIPWFITSLSMYLLSYHIFFTFSELNRSIFCFYQDHVGGTVDVDLEVKALHVVDKTVKSQSSYTLSPGLVWSLKKEASQAADLRALCLWGERSSETGARCPRMRVEADRRRSRWKYPKLERFVWIHLIDQWMFEYEPQKVSDIFRLSMTLPIHFCLDFNQRFRLCWGLVLWPCHRTQERHRWRVKCPSKTSRASQWPVWRSTLRPSFGGRWRLAVPLEKDWQKETLKQVVQVVEDGARSYSTSRS